MAAECDANMIHGTPTVPLKAGRGSTSRAIFILAMIFLSSLLCLFLVYLNFPKLEPSEKQHIKLPRDIEDAKGLGRVLNRYTDRYFFAVTSGFFVTYILVFDFIRGLDQFV